MREAIALSVLVQGVMVLLSYIIYFPDHNMWAGLNDVCVFYVWCVTSSLATAGFLSFTYALLFWVDDGSQIYFITVFPYSAFLAASACYMPLAAADFKTWTIGVLVVAALGACALLYCSIILLGASWITYLVGALAFHCTAVDLIFWGFTWTHPPPRHDSEA
jgi:hypothetical protein